MKIRCIIVVISFVLGGIGGWKLNDFINKEEISTDYLTAKLEDVAQAISKAKKDVKNNPSVDMTSLLQRADENTEKLIHTILDDSVKDCKVVVRFVNS